MNVLLDIISYLTVIKHSPLGKSDALCISPNTLLRHYFVFASVLVRMFTTLHVKSKQMFSQNTEQIFNYNKDIETEERNIRIVYVHIVKQHDTASE